MKKNEKKKGKSDVQNIIQVNLELIYLNNFQGKFNIENMEV